MAQVTIEVNGRPYVVGCEDGQEQHLRDLAHLFDRQVRSVSQDMGQLGDMGALLMADELYDARQRLAAMQTELTRLQTGQSRTENRAVMALESAAKRIEQIANS
jgi:cell division protein ZapA